MVGLNKIFTPLIILLLAFFANYATSILLANIMSIENFGIINYALTLIPIAAQILLLGTGSSAKQFLNRYIYDHEENQTSSYINWNINIIYWPLKISIILGFFTLIVIDPLEIIFLSHVTETTRLVTYLFVASPMLAGINLISSFLLCDDHIELSTFIKAMGFYILLLSCICTYTIFFYTDGFATPIESVLRIMTVCYILLIIIALFVLRKHSPILFNSLTQFEKTPVHNKETHPKWQKTAKKQLFYNVSNTFIARMDFMLLALFSPTHAQLAIYGVAIKTASILEKIPKGIFKHLSPKISILTKDEQTKKELQRLWNQSLKYNVIIMIFFAYLLRHSDTLILYIYSDNYKPVLDIIHIMRWSFFIYAIGGRKEILLQYSGYVQYINVANLSRPIIFLIIGFFLYPIYGLKGIALASLTTTILNQIYMYICIKYLLKFKPYGLF